MSSFLNICA